MTINIYFWSFLAQFFLELEIFQTKAVQKIRINDVSSEMVPFIG